MPIYAGPCPRRATWTRPLRALRNLAIASGQAGRQVVCDNYNIEAACAATGEHSAERPGHGSEGVLPIAVSQWSCRQDQAPRGFLRQYAVTNHPDSFCACAD